MTRGRKTAWALIRAAIGIGLLGFVLSRLDPKEILGVLRGIHGGYLALAFFWQAIAKLVWTDRWREILLATGIRHRFRDLLALVLIGLFFNSFLPTSIGGDLVRGWNTSQGEGGRAASYAAVLVERALGGITLALMAAAAACVALVAGDQPVDPRWLLAVVTAGCAIAAAGSLPFVWRGWRRFPPWRWIGERRPRLRDGLENALDLFRRPDTPRARILFDSLALQVIAVLFHIATARAVGLEVPAVVFFLVVPASVIASMLPVTLNGLGIRETVLVTLLVAYGAPRAEVGAFAVLALLVATAFALLGGLIYPFHRMSKEEGRRVPADP